MKAAIYAREEKFRRADNLEDQVQFCREFAQEKNLIVHEDNIYEDLGIISSLNEDSSLLRLLHACRAGTVQAVIVEHHHFLADSPKFYDQLVSELETLGITLFALADFPGFDRWVEYQGSN